MWHSSANQKLYTYTNTQSQHSETQVARESVYALCLRSEFLRMLPDCINALHITAFRPPAQVTEQFCVWHSEWCGQSINTTNAQFVECSVWNSVVATAHHRDCSHSIRRRRRRRHSQQTIQTADSVTVRVFGCIRAFVNYSELKCIGSGDQCVGVFDYIFLVVIGHRLFRI